MTWTIKQGDLEPAYSAQLLVDDAAFDMTGSTISFVLTNTSTGVQQVNSPATVDDVLNSKVSYHWQTGDTAIVGTYRAEWILTTAGRPRTFPQRGYTFIEIEAR